VEVNNIKYFATTDLQLKEKNTTFPDGEQNQWLESGDTSVQNTYD